MEIEQLPPNKPNFLLIVVLFVGAIFAILLISYFFVRRAEKRTPDGQHSSLHSPEPFAAHMDAPSAVLNA